MTTARNKLIKLLAEVRPLDIAETQYLVDKTIEASKLIQGQEIVLFVGPTGAGKTTTILFLSGAELVLEQYEYAPGKSVPHITAKEPLKYEAMRPLKTSPLSKSETRYIYPISIPVRDIIPGASGNITFCDAAGSGDLAGAEVDIANTVGLVNALAK
eukprot:CAMPEP_0206199162 /NCGR_PEP_ID=MMETSP0166-20121206/10096_1 /ASSEMBLY_ACC=CAM_ASM_000260 /TAXON_ID=95228 /ORGANISM="Vannella robusta, Strain DIVA3 518/3/11/1/6" /LENGTH=156 /DNA_ID=CAMNT_0053617209 /DNA_START=349 /DNA_END=819 /DNA_ORIENTATION=+